jgi:hypothetical protein
MRTVTHRLPGQLGHTKQMAKDKLMDTQVVYKMARVVRTAEIGEDHSMNAKRIATHSLASDKTGGAQHTPWHQTKRVGQEVLTPYPCLQCPVQHTCKQKMQTYTQKLQTHGLECLHALLSEHRNSCSNFLSK